VATAAVPPEYLWVHVGSTAATNAAGSAQTADLLARVAGALPIDLPAGATPPDPVAPIYIASALRAAVPTLVADLAAAGLDPRVSSAPPTLEAAVRTSQAYALFTGASGGASLPSAARSRALLGEAYLLLHLAD
jgi:hypothetical protein